MMIADTWIDPEDPKIGQLSVELLKPLLVYFVQCHDEAYLRELIDCLELAGGIDLDYLNDSEHWLEFEAAQKIIDILDEYSKDPDFIKNAGLLVATKAFVGKSFAVLKALGTPQRYYKELFRNVSLNQRVGLFRLYRIEEDFLCFGYRSLVDEPNLRFSNLRMAEFASVPTIWGLPPAEVSKSQCQVTGESAKESLYEVRWKPVVNKRPIVYLGLAGMVVGGVLGTLLTDTLAWGYIFFWGVLGLALGRIIYLQQKMASWKTVLRERNHQLLRSNEALQRRYTHLQSINEHLEKADALKDQCMVNVSHELRAPLVALSSTVQLLLNQTSRQDLASQEKLLHSSAASLQDMLENVDDLLLKARSEEGVVEMNWSALPIVALVKETVDAFQPLVVSSEISLELCSKIEASQTIYADRAKLKKIINNLLSNAIKFTHEGYVDVILEKDGDHIVLSIKDSGTGIPATEQKSIFEPFYQATNNPLRNIKGAGIGLSLVRDLVSLHHGTIKLDSELNVGCCFTVRLPLGNAHVVEQHLDNETDWDCLGRDQAGYPIYSHERLELPTFNRNLSTVLIVEDDLQMTQVLVCILRQEFNLLVAKEGRQAFEKAKTHRPDVIISDIIMPKKNGWQLLESIRNDDKLKTTAFILLSVKADQASRMAGFQAGADEYIAKPFSNLELLARVQGLLQRKKFEAEFIGSEKMAALGQLTAGVAYEMDNPVNYTNSAAITVAKALQDMRNGSVDFDTGVNTAQQAVQRVCEGTARIVEIAGSLRRVTRPWSEGVKLYDIHHGIDSTLKILRENYKADIEIEKEYRLRVPIKCNANRLNQVIMNILQNAFHAVAHCEHKQISVSTYSDAEWAYIVIENNGPCVPDELLEKIFEPFFTTKHLDTGTGLGLHLCRQIIDEHGGALTLVNRDQGGVRCCIQLPLSPGGKHE